MLGIPSNPLLGVLRRPSVKIYIPLQGFLEVGLCLLLTQLCDEAGFKAGTGKQIYSIYNHNGVN